MNATVPLRTLEIVATAAGLAAGDFLTTLGIEKHRLGDVRARIPHHAGVAVWEHAARRHGANFGLRMATMAPQGAFGAAEYAFRNGATLGESLRGLVRHCRLLHEAMQMKLAVEDGVARLVCWLPGELSPLPRYPLEALFARVVLLGQRGTRASFGARDVCFCHAAPADAAEHRRLFGVHARFNQVVNELRFDAALLDLPVTDADPVLHSLMEDHANSLLAGLGEERDFLGQVRFRVAEALQDGVPSAKRIARCLCLSERSFYRRLSDEGTTYRGVIDDVRRDLAIRRILEPRSSLAELALVLGFSDVSAFYRAFRRWTGMTPLEYRHGAMAEGDHRRTVRRPRARRVRPVPRRTSSAGGLPGSAACSATACSPSRRPL